MKGELSLTTSQQALVAIALITTEPCVPTTQILKKISEIKNMVNLLLKNRQRSIIACDVIINSGAELYQESDVEGFNDEDEAMNYNGAQGFYQNRGSNNNFGINSNLS